MCIRDRALFRSAEISGLEEEVPEEEMSKFDKFLTRKLGDKLPQIIMTCSLVLALVLSIGLFLSLIHIYTLSSESFSVGGRIASFSGLEYIYPVDKVLPLNAEMLGNEIWERIMPRLNFLKKCDEISDIRKKYQFLNSSEYRLQDANIYLDINAENRDGDYFESR